MIKSKDMDGQDSERIKIAKPVASRPSHSTFRSFTELLAGAIDEPLQSLPKATLIPIRPKTVKFKPTANCSQRPNPSVSSQAETLGTATSHPHENVQKPHTEPTIVYKPLARLVSKTTASLLAKMGNFDASNRAPQPPLSGGQHPRQDKSSQKPQLSLNDKRNAASHAETHQPGKLLHTGAPTNAEESQKQIPAVANCDRPSYDGYNWRKYGQKQVKGSEFPRSYYKCTHPSCPVKKKVERSLDGEITEIVYKGEHNHLKPQPAKRGSSSQSADPPATDGIGQDDGNPIWSNEALGRAENEMGTGIAATSDFAFLGKAPLLYDHSAGEALGQASATQDSSCGLSGEEDGGKRKYLADIKPRSKKRKKENRSEEVGLAEHDAQEDPTVAKQNLADPDKLSDGFRWRKYGQKVVKGNPYPRSYYRCTTLKCNVRKYVERASDSPRSFLTTYEGKHNHEMPLKNDNNAHNP